MYCNNNDVGIAGIVTACSGGHLELMCSTTGTFLRWYTRPNIENEPGRTYTRTLSSLLVVSNAEPLMINSTTFCVSRTSIQGSLPLVSRLVISPVSEILNRTEVKCEDVILGTNSSITTIYVHNGDKGIRLLFRMHEPVKVYSY